MYFDSFANAFGSIIKIALESAWVWGPIGLLVLAWELWLTYVRREYLNSLKWALLEVRLPREIYKSPLAMELVLSTAFYQTGGVGNWMQKYWQGNLPIWFSLEMVSLGGEVRFFIRTQEKFKIVIQSQIYAQYPEVEIIDAEDYTDNVPEFTKGGEWNLFGTEFLLTKADPYPIKTYVDYGLDKSIGSLDEEQRIDPLTSVMEFLGSVGSGEQAWIQIIIRPSNWGRYPDKESQFALKKWQDVGQDLIKELNEKWQKPQKDTTAPSRLTKGQQEVLNAIERSLDKFGFDTGIRAIYLARGENFNPAQIAALTGALRQFNSNTLNGFRPNNVTGYDFPWQDMFGDKLIG
ncbi:MAG: hypothetical protein KA007_02595, partial [Candidatus Pacebacteria bacterium]|nr:hypothetical protein [Candidatus Paceibacterota bacterium]